MAMSLQLRVFYNRLDASNPGKVTPEAKFPLGWCRIPSPYPRLAPLVVILQTEVGNQLLPFRCRRVFFSFINWMNKSCSG
jgi:hypothetical protein